MLALALAALVATGLRTGRDEVLFYAGVLLAMSLNRFLLAALSAALPHTIEPGEYMVANSVVPTIGSGRRADRRRRRHHPAAAPRRHVLPDYQANAAVFALAAVGLRDQRLAGAADPAPPARPRHLAPTRRAT